MAYNIRPNIYPFNSSGTRSTSLWVLEANLSLSYLSRGPDPQWNSFYIKVPGMLGRMGLWKWKSLSRVWLFVTPWTVAYQAPPSMEFSRQEHWSELPFPSPGDLPDTGIEPKSPALWADALPSEPPRMRGSLKRGSKYFSKKYTPNQSILKEISPKYWCWSWNFNTLDTWCKEPAHWKRPWCWERLRAGGKGGNGGWDV